MKWPDDPAVLLAGPRGRRLCLELARDFGSFPTDTREMIAKARLLDILENSSAPTAIAVQHDERTLLASLANAVDTAMYWQEPDETDRALDDPEICRALLPVARAVVAAPGAAWWPDPIDLDHQAYVQFVDAQHDDPPLQAEAGPELRRWRVAADRHELAARQAPTELTRTYSGDWWSAPISNLTSTTRMRTATGPIGLSLVEDTMGNLDAYCWPLLPRRSPRIYEIRTPHDWGELAARYPLDVHLSRRHDWWQVTGLAGAWVIPDWEAVAAEYDAVHLTVRGYLTSAGRAVRAGGAHTVLAGWNPDETFWLTDILTADGPPTRWQTKQNEAANWSRVVDQ